jgi:hypothetical protein
MFNLWSVFDEIGKDIITYGHRVYYETEGEKQMNKEQKIQELTKRIENSQAEIDELKEELKKLQKKPYEISYPDNGTEVYFINDYYGDISEREYDAFDKNYKHLYDTGLYFDTEEEAEQFKREQTLIKKIKCWVREQQGDWKLDWSDKNQCKYSIDVDRFNKETICDWCWGHDKLSKLPYFKSKEIALACINEFGNEILEVFC